MLVVHERITTRPRWVTSKFESFENLLWKFFLIKFENLKLKYMKRLSSGKRGINWLLDVDRADWAWWFWTSQYNEQDRMYIVKKLRKSLSAIFFFILPLFPQLMPNNLIICQPLYKHHIRTAVPAASSCHRSWPEHFPSCPPRSWTWAGNNLKHYVLYDWNQINCNSVVWRSSYSIPVTAMVSNTS